MKKSLRIGRLLLPGAVLMSSCVAVYVPTTPSTPLLEKGQVEVTAGLRSLHYGEVNAAWSPAPHLLLTAETAFDLDNIMPEDTDINTHRDTHRQGGVGIGVYGHPGAKQSYLALTGGIGWGHSNFFASDDYQAASVFFPLPVPTRQGVYDASYRRYYGQLYIASPEADKGPRIGGSLRAVWLDYTRLTYADQPIVTTSRAFLEPSFFVRFGKGPLRFYFSGGLSLPLSSDRANPADGRTASKSYLFGGGVILRPDLLRHHDH